MKTSLFLVSALFALGSSVQAASIIFDYQANPGQTSALYNPTVTGGASFSNQFLTNSSGGGITQNAATQYTNSFLTPASNVGTGSPWTLKLSFTVTEDVTIDSISLNLFTYNGSGTTQQDSRQGAYTFSLKQGEDVLAGCANSSVIYQGTSDSPQTGTQTASVDTLGQQGGTSGVREESALDKAVTLTAGETYSIELSLERGAERNGYFVGLGAIELNAVPEPATASLGLLGLAALMMRRRRA